MKKWLYNIRRFIENPFWVEWKFLDRENTTLILSVPDKGEINNDSDKKVTLTLTDYNGEISTDMTFTEFREAVETFNRALKEVERISSDD